VASWHGEPTAGLRCDWILLPALWCMNWNRTLTPPQLRLVS